MSCDRRWFLGSVGSVIGALAAPALFKKGMDKIEVLKPHVITSEEGITILLHQIADRPPPEGAPGFGMGCIWQDARGIRIWVNNGTRIKAHWNEVEAGERQERFLRMVLNQRSKEFGSFQQDLI